LRCPDLNVNLEIALAAAKLFVKEIRLAQRKQSSLLSRSDSLEDVDFGKTAEELRYAQRRKAVTLSDG